VRDAHSAGARAATRSVVSDLRVTQTDETSFRVESRFGDAGTVEIGPDGAGSVVSSRTAELYVGSPQAGHFRSGVMGLSAAIVHLICTLLGVSPGAGRTKRFQLGVEGRIARQLQRSAQV
jgi:hypothetical protein